MLSKGFQQLKMLSKARVGVCVSAETEREYSVPGYWPALTFDFLREETQRGLGRWRMSYMPLIENQQSRY